MVDGAVYGPAGLMPPRLGTMDQVTVLDAPVTVAENCCVCPTVSAAVGGVAVTPIEDEGDRVRVTLPLEFGLTTLVATTVTLVLLELSQIGGYVSPWPSSVSIRKEGALQLRTFDR